MKTFTPHINIQKISKNQAYLTMQIVCSDKRVKYNLGLPAIDITKDTGHWDKFKKGKEVKRSAGKLSRRAPSEYHKKADFILGLTKKFVEGKEEVFAVDLVNYLKKEEDPSFVPKALVGGNKGKFFKAVEALIDDKNLKTLRKQEPYSEGTRICWRKTLNKLQEYLPNLTFDVTMTDYKSFVDQCEKATEPKLSRSYIGSLIKDWKTFMAHLEKNEEYAKAIGKSAYNHKDFKQISEDPITVALTEEELEKLRIVELPYKSMQDQIRDRFVFNCTVGIRISDMEKLEEDAVIEDGYLSLVTIKTSEPICVDLTGDYYRITAKYDGKLPYQYHRNVVNREIKKIGKLAGINSIVMGSRIVGGVEEHIKAPKYEFLSNHVARRTFGTLQSMHNDASDVADTMGISVKTFQESYDKKTPKDVAKKFRERRLKREAEAA